MALITCPECGNKVSEKADICPNCGYQLSPEQVVQILAEEQRKRNKKNKIVMVIAIIFGIFYIIGSLSSDSDKTKTSKPKTKEEIRKEELQKHFNLWDGSHRNLTAHIKKNMNDPDSYKHVKTVYWDNGDHLVVKTTFRGTNAFGGVVTNTVTAKVSLTGGIIEVLSQGP